MAEALVCPRCYTTSETGTAYCRDCGASLAEVGRQMTKNKELLTTAANAVLKTGSLEGAREEIAAQLDRTTAEIRQQLTTSDAKIPVAVGAKTEEQREWIRDRMAEAGLDPEGEELTPLETTRLLQAMNLNMGYGGHQWNALQVTQLCDPMTSETREAFYKAYNAYYRRALAGPFSGRIWIGVALAGVLGAIWALPEEPMGALRGIVFSASLAAVVYAAVRMDRINTHWDGFYSGFSDGKRRGVLSALEITSDDEVQDLTERAEEMERFVRTFGCDDPASVA